MKSEYNALVALKNHPGWPILQGLWAFQHQKLINGMRKSAKGNKETSWRYFAGQQEGFELAITQLDRALIDMEKDEDNLEASQEAQQQVDDLLKKIKGDQK